MKTLLVVVDYQVDFVNGALGFQGASLIEAPICKAILDQRKKGGEVCFTLDTHTETYLETQEGQNLPVVHCIKGTPGWALFGQVADLQQPQDQVFEKPAFGSMELMNYVKKGGYDQVTFMGLVSHICVLANAVLVKSALPEAQVQVDCACTASFDPELHEKALDVMKGLQIKLINQEDL